MKASKRSAATSNRKRKLSAWQQSTDFRMISRAAITKYNQDRHLLPKCGAMAKSTGEPCQNIALDNGRCRYHGGKTPSGDGWHRPVWPNRDAPDAVQKMHAKLRDLDRAARRRAKKLSAMTAEEKARHEAWHRDHPVATTAGRAEQTRLRQDALAARGLLSAPRKDTLAEDPEYQAIVARIAELKAKLAAAAQSSETQNSPQDGVETTEEGVFG